MTEIKQQFKGNVGLFLVCAELSKNNLIALPTSRNTKGYDLAVLGPETGKSISLQVKCTDKKDYPIFSSHWKDYKEKIKEKILCDFIFVDISELDNPNYYILSKSQMRSLMKSIINGYNRDYQNRHNLSFEQMLAMEERSKRKQDLWAVKLKYLLKYKEKWDVIFNQLY